MRRTDEATIEMIHSFWESAKAWRGSVMLDRWRKSQLLYRSYIDRGSYPWQSQLFIPVTFNICEQATARYSVALTGTTPLVRIDPKHPKSIESAGKVEMWMEDSVREAKLRREIMRFIKQAVVYGTGLIKHRWRFEEARSGEVLFDGPVSEVQALSRFWCDPHAPDIDSADRCLTTQRRSVPCSFIGDRSTG